MSSLRLDTISITRRVILLAASATSFNRSRSSASPFKWEPSVRRAESHSCAGVCFEINPISGLAALVIVMDSACSANRRSVSQCGDVCGRDGAVRCRYSRRRRGVVAVCGRASANCRGCSLLSPDFSDEKSCCASADYTVSFSNRRQLTHVCFLVFQAEQSCPAQNECLQDD